MAAGRSFGPASGMHVVIAGHADTGYAARIYDGSTFVTSRGMTGPYDLTALPRVVGTVHTSCVLGATNICTDLQQLPFSGDGVTTPVTVDGLSGLKTVQVVPNDLNIYFEFPTSVVYNGDFTAAFSIEYYDQGTSYLALQYDSTNAACGPLSGAYCTAGVVPETNTGTWKTASFTVSNARFAGRENGGADFRIASPLPFIIHSVAVTVSGAGVNSAVTPANRLQNRYNHFSFDPATQTLTLSGAINTIQGDTFTRFETYRLVNSQVIASSVGITSSGPATAWFTPYTSFHAGWRPLWLGGYSSYYDSPHNDSANGPQDSPLPMLGASSGRHIYGVESASTWGHPVPGYNSPHLRIRGLRLAAPQMGTQSNPIVLSPGITQSWESVFFRSAPSLYAMELAGEVAMANTLGFNQANSPGVSVGSTQPTQAPNASGNGLTAKPPEALVLDAMHDFGLIDRATSYWLRETSASGSKDLAPSTHYSPGTYMRDSFWTGLALGSAEFASTEPALFNQFTAAIATSGPNAGHVPVSLGGPLYPDESSALYLIRMYNDDIVHHLHVGNAAIAKLVLDYIQTDQVKHGAFLTAGPATYGGSFVISPDSWLDGYLYPSGAIDAYDQGIYVVALEAAQKLGLAVTNAQIAQADAAYQSLYDPTTGYLRWLSTTTYKSPDVLAGDALSLLLFNKALLPASEVVSTLDHQAWTPYGMKALATENGDYVPASDFATLELNGSGSVVSVGEPGGWYQNGGSWVLYEYLAEYAAARQGDAGAYHLMARSIRDEVAVTPLSKEFKRTNTEPSYSYPSGSSTLDRQGYGWNTAIVRFALSLSHPATGSGQQPVPLAPTVNPFAHPAAPAGQAYGPSSGMHVVVTGDTASGYQATIADGSRLVATRQLSGVADLNVETPATTTGANLLTAPTGQLAWTGPVGPGAGGTISSAAGGQAESWSGTTTGPAWVYLADLPVTAGNTYRFSYQLSGSGSVYMDVYNGVTDVTTTPVTLSSTPQTVSMDVTFPASDTAAQLAHAEFQVRTASAGSLDATWTAASIFVMTTPTSVGLTNHYTHVAYDPATRTLTLSGATNTVDGTTLSRWESYRFVSAQVTQSKVGIDATGGSTPLSVWSAPYADFPAGWKGMRVFPRKRSPEDWFINSYSSTRRPLGAGGNAAEISPIPVVGVYNGRHIYGIAAGDTWQYPVDGYVNPHLTVATTARATELSAPQVGTAAYPITVAPGSSQSWMQVLYRTTPSAYAFELGGEVAMAQALGYTQTQLPGVAAGPARQYLATHDLPSERSVIANPPTAAEVGTAMQDWGQVLEATAYWELQRTPSGDRTVVPSNAYEPAMYMRDSFWTLMGLHGPLGRSAERYAMGLFSSNVVQTGVAAGEVPTYVTPPNGPVGYGQLGGGGTSIAQSSDETDLLYLIRMYYDVNVRHLDVRNRHDAQLALDYVQRDHVCDCHAFINIAPYFSSWLDTGYTPGGSVDAYNQGLYAVALKAAKGLGLSVSEGAASAAAKAYGALYNSELGYIPWNNDFSYKSPDVLAGEAWSLFLFNRSILPRYVVQKTIAAQARTPYGLVVLAEPGGGYLGTSRSAPYTSPSVFETGIGALDAPGHYQNGGDWYLFDYWAAYAGARLHIPGSQALLSWATQSQVGIDPTSHEYLLTNAYVPTPASYVVPGSSPNYRQGYGWNDAFNAFEATIGRGVSG